MREQPRVMGVLMGDILRNPDAQTKYGLLFEAVARRFPLVDVYDASLRGLTRLVNTATTFHVDRERWRQHFYKNAPAFRARSRQIGAMLGHPQPGLPDNDTQPLDQSLIPADRLRP